MSFDQRVSQYEEDIRERGSQRALPGWNFCTFFVLKEGLARGFESVGLVDDALVVYDELSVGLDSIVRDQVGDESATSGGTLLDHTQDLANSVAKLGEAQTLPLEEKKKPYRELILANNISLFDFKCYIFTRQAALLLRLGNALSSRSQLMIGSDIPRGRQTSVDVSSRPKQPETTFTDSEDPLSLAELCQRALAFITTIAQILREDLNIG